MRAAIHVSDNRITIINTTVIRRGICFSKNRWIASDIVREVGVSARKSGEMLTEYVEDFGEKEKVLDEGCFCSRDRGVRS